MLCRPIVCTIKGHGCLYQRGLALVFMPTRIARSYTQLSTGSEAGNPAWPGHPGKRFPMRITHSLARAQRLSSTACPGPRAPWEALPCRLRGDTHSLARAQRLSSTACPGPRGWRNREKSCFFEYNQCDQADERVNNSPCRRSCPRGLRGVTLSLDLEQSREVMLLRIIPSVIKQSREVRLLCIKT